MCEVDLAIKTYKELNAKETILRGELQKIIDEKHDLMLIITAEPDWIRFFQE